MFVARLSARFPWLERWLRRRPLLSRVIDNLAWQAMDKGLRIVGGLVVTVVLARHLGPEVYGTYSWVLALVGSVSGLATLGLPQMAVKALVNEGSDLESRAQILGSTMALLLAGSALAMSIAYVSSHWLWPDERSMSASVLLVAATLPLQSAAIVRWWFESQVAAQPAIGLEGAVLVGGIVAKLLAVALGAPLMVFFLLLALEAAVLSALQLRLYSRCVGALREWRVRGERIRMLLLQSWPLALSGVLLMVQARVDQIMLGALAGESELGQYSVALRLAEGFAFLPLVLQSTVFPVLVGARQQGFEAFRARLLHVYRLCILVALAVCVALALLGPWLLHLLFGDVYAPAGPLLAWMSLRVLLSFIGTARGLFLLVEDLQRWATVTLFAGTVVNVLLNLWWIPSLGALGAVWASLVSFTVSTLLVDLLHPRARANIVDLLRAALTLPLLRKV